MDKLTAVVHAVLVTLWCDSPHAEINPLSHPAISALAFSSESEVLASAGREGIRLWDVRSGRILKTLHGHKIQDPCGPGQVWATTGLTFLTRDILVSAGEDGNIHLWDIHDGSLIRSIAEPWIYRVAGVDSLLWLRRVPVDAIAVSIDEKYIAACMFGTVQIWELSTGDHVRSCGAEGLRKESLVVDSLFPATRKDAVDDTMRQYLRDFLKFPDRNAVPAELERWRTTQPVLDDLHQVAFSGNLKQVVAAGSHCVYVWNLLSGEPELKVDTASSFAVSPDSTVLLTGSRFGPMQVWNLATGELVRVIEDRCSGVQFSPHGQTFITANRDALSTWRVDSWSKERSFPDALKAGSPEVFAVSPNSDLLAAGWSGWDERRIRIWNLNDEE